MPALPVVAMARTGIREFVANGREGLLAQSDRDMVEQLLRLICDPQLRQRIATHNRDVASNVDWSRVVPVNVDVYRRAIELRASGADRGRHRLSRRLTGWMRPVRPGRGRVRRAGRPRACPTFGTRPARVNTRARP